jgi:hypothetical protein
MWETMIIFPIVKLWLFYPPNHAQQYSHTVVGGAKACLFEFGIGELRPPIVVSVTGGSKASVRVGCILGIILNSLTGVQCLLEELFHARRQWSGFWYAHVDTRHIRPELEIVVIQPAVGDAPYMPVCASPVTGKASVFEHVDSSRQFVVLPLSLPIVFEFNVFGPL